MLQTYWRNYHQAGYLNHIKWLKINRTCWDMLMTVTRTLWGPPEHYGMHIICNDIVVFMLIYALFAHVRICMILLYLCWFVTWVREHNCILAILECSSPAYGKPQKTRTKCSRHTLWQIYTLISESPRHMNHPLWNMGRVAKVLEK
jgi:hypothetical protein